MLEKVWFWSLTRCDKQIIQRLTKEFSLIAKVSRAFQGDEACSGKRKERTT